MAYRSANHTIIVDLQTFERLKALRESPELERDLAKSWSRLLNALMDEIGFAKVPVQSDVLKGGEPNET